MSNKPSTWRPFHGFDSFLPNGSNFSEARLPLEEHVEGLRAHVLEMVHGQSPTPKQTKQGKAQANELMEWCRTQWEDTPLACAKLEDRVYTIGWLSLWWKLAGDMIVFRDTLCFLRDWLDTAGHNAIAAITSGSSREDEEWRIVATAIADVEYQAIRKDSLRLKAIARVMRQMLTRTKLEPHAPEQNVRTQAARANANRRHAETNALKQQVLADWKKDRARPKDLREYASKADCARTWAKDPADLQNPQGTIYRWLTRVK